MVALWGHRTGGVGLVALRVQTGPTGPVTLTAEERKRVILDLKAAG